MEVAKKWGIATKIASVLTGITKPKKDAQIILIFILYKCADLLALSLISRMNRNRGKLFTRISIDLDVEYVM